MKPMIRFISSYQGEAEYEVLGTPEFPMGVRVRAREFFSLYNSVRRDLQIHSFDEVGTVRFAHWPESNTFPPASVMAFFLGYTAARYDEELDGADFTVEYQFARPEVFYEEATDSIKRFAYRVGGI